MTTDLSPVPAGTEREDRERSLTADERAAINYAGDLRLWVQGYWWVRDRNRPEYRTVPLTEAVAKQDAVRWPGDYYAEPMPRPAAVVSSSPATPTWDGQHRTYPHFKSGKTLRAICSCGWQGPERIGSMNNDSPSLASQLVQKDRRDHERASFPATPAGHDEQCEAEWESGAMAYTVCGCEHRASSPATPEGGRCVECGHESAVHALSYDRPCNWCACLAYAAPSPASPAETREGGPDAAWVSWRAGGMAETQVGVRSTAYKGGWCTPQGVVPDEWVEATEPIRAAASPAVSLPGEQVRAVEIALEIEQYVHDRGDFDRGVQTTCSRVRRALSDPDSFINPVPQVGVSEQ